MAQEIGSSDARFKSSGTKAVESVQLGCSTRMLQVCHVRPFAPRLSQFCNLTVYRLKNKQAILMDGWKKSSEAQFFQAAQAGDVASVERMAAEGVGPRKDTPTFPHKPCPEDGVPLKYKLSFGMAV
eukprot:4561893-Amphidinium_carterae.1